MHRGRRGRLADDLDQPRRHDDCADDPARDDHHDDDDPADDDHDDHDHDHDYDHDHDHTTTTTVPPTTTTTVPGNGVTVSASAVTSGRVLSDALTIDNSAELTSLAVTITVDASRGERYSSMTSSYPRGTVSTRHTGSATISYTFSLASRRTVPAGSRGVLTAEFTLRSGSHPASGDSWSVTSTAGGVTVTDSGTF